MSSHNKLHQIAIALHNYAETNNGRLPPAATYDSEGRPLLSWRVLLLPYIEEEELYKEFHLDEPWDSPHNITLLPRMPKTYRAPPDFPVGAKPDPNSTFYQAFVGPRAGFDATRGLRMPQDFPDGTSNTILVIEGGSTVPWSKPEDISYDPDAPLPPIGGLFTGEGRFGLLSRNRLKGFNVALADGSVRFVYAPFDETALREYIDRDDGKGGRELELPGDRP
jgi:Protein of unknown function (DUF1559)